jgi:hypothetical protein
MLLERILVKTISYLNAAVCVIALGFVTGCGSPTKKFEAFIAKASASLEADADLKANHMFDPVKYDVKKTTSTVSPFQANVILSGVNLPIYARKQLRLFRGDMELAAGVVKTSLDLDEAKAKQLVQDAKQQIDPKEIDPKASRGKTRIDIEFEQAVEATKDDGFRTYRFTYAYQDDKWVLTDSQIEVVDPVQQLVGIPSKIKGYFTP